VIYAWSGIIMTASGAVIWYTLRMANAMDRNTSHAVRCAALVLSVTGLWGFLAPIAGQMHAPYDPAAWLLLGVALLMMSDRRRPIHIRDRVTSEITQPS
jgi:hypothetical protein